MVEGKYITCDKWVLHVSYQLPVMFSTFSVLVLFKMFLRKAVSQCDRHDIP